MDFLNFPTDLSEANQYFACNLYKRILATGPTRNMFFSPFSISVSLAIILTGAREKTADQIRKALGFQDMSVDILNSYFKTLLEEIMKSKSDQSMGSVSIANGIFIQEGFQILPSFVNTIQHVYNAVSMNLDFANNCETSLSLINDWVREKTRDKIRKLLDSCDATTVMTIVNAIYFKSFWKNKFDPNRTSSSIFHLDEKNTVQVKMMIQLNKDCKHTFNEVADCDVLELQYEDRRISFVVFLPRNIDGLSKVESLLTPGFLKDCLVSLTSSGSVEVQLPVFKLEERYSLISELKALGVEDLFVPHLANISGISSGLDLAVNDVIHKSVLEVNEEGTEAAAATAVPINHNRRQMTTRFKADRPFLFCIVDRTSSILFIGSLKNPESL